MTPSDGFLGAAHRVIRPVRSPQDAPWPGSLVQLRDGASCVLVDVTALGAQWPGWSAPGGGHVLTPSDVLRRVDGHDAVLPVCSERLDDFLSRRASRLPLSTGEAVTLGVSLLRGSGEIAATPDAIGEWWLDADGRPVLAMAAGERRVRDGAIDALAAVATEPRLQPAWTRVREALAAPRLSARALVEAEDALFAAAEAEPLTTVSLAPRPAAEVSRVPGSTAGVAVDHEPGRPLWHRLAAHADADLADMFSRATTSVWRRLRARPGSRRAPWLVGGATAALVLTGGALWPSTGGVATEAPGPAATATATATAAPTGAPAPPGDAVAPPVDAADTDPAVRVADLLTARTACEGDDACVRRLQVDPAAVFPPGAVDLAPGERAVTLIDDYGDIAVFRVDPVAGAAAPQLVVVMRQNDGWLLRDVHDVAQQP